jgi:hypothetical protein
LNNEDSFIFPCGRHFFAAVRRRQSFTFLHQFSVQIEKFSIAN